MPEPTPPTVVRGRQDFEESGVHYVGAPWNTNETRSAIYATSGERSSRRFA
ncbi:MAG: hypothetical protein AABN33_07995 [Acidobacteriota bacterium]